MAASDFSNMMSRIEAALTQQAAVVGALNQRSSQGDANIEQRFAASEKRMADALGSTMHALGKLAQDLDEYGSRDSTTDDEWGRAYECGERAMSQRVNVVVSHLANQLVTRSVS